MRPGLAVALAAVGYATIAAFIVLMLEARGIGHGATVFAAFAAMIVIARLIAGGLPDRFGPAPVAIGAALIESAGLLAIAVAGSLPVALVGGMAMGAAFSLLNPALMLIAVGGSRSRPRRRDGHLHRLLRRRRRRRRAAGGRGGGADQLRGRVRARGGGRASARRRSS